MKKIFFLIAATVFSVAIFNGCKSATVIAPAGTNPLVELQLTSANVNLGNIITGEAELVRIIGFIIVKGGEPDRGYLAGAQYHSAEQPCPLAMYNALQKAPDADFVMAPKIEIQRQDYFFFSKTLCKITGRAAKYVQ